MNSKNRPALLDSKALALFRLALGLLVLCDTLVALSQCNTFYSDFGVLPLGQLLESQPRYGQLSLYFACRWWAWSACLLLLQSVLALLLILGIRVRPVALALTFLVYSLQGRNPYIIGLADYWVLALLIACSLCQVSAHWSVSDTQQRTVRTAPWGTPLFYTLVLVIPAGIICAALFADIGSVLSQRLGSGRMVWGWLAICSLLCFMQNRSHRFARGLGFLLFNGTFLWLFGPCRVLLVAVIASIPFLCLSKPLSDQTEEDTVMIVNQQLQRLVLITALLQAWPVASSLLAIDSPATALILESEPPVPAQQRIGLRSVHDREAPALLWDQLECQSFLMARYLNSLDAWGKPSRWQNFLTYHHHRAHPNSPLEGYEVYDLSHSPPITRLILVPSPAQPPLLQGFPPLNRD